MRCILTGTQDMQFQMNGEEIDGVKLHFLSVDPNVVGKAAANQFVKRHVFDSFGVNLAEMSEILGTEINIDFNNKGKIVGFSV
jgi:hypothetical protein